MMMQEVKHPPPLSLMTPWRVPALSLGTTLLSELHSAAPNSNTVGFVCCLQQEAPNEQLSESESNLSPNSFF